MVREVSEDQIYDTIEFNEFLQMMSKQQSNSMTEDSLKDAFRQATFSINCEEICGIEIAENCPKNKPKENQSKNQIKLRSHALNSTKRTQQNFVNFLQLDLL